MTALLDDASTSPAARVVPTLARRCPVCDADDADALFDNRMAPIAAIDFSYRVLACHGCGMVYASQTPDDATIARYYRDASKYDYPTSTTQLNAGDCHRAEVAAAFTGRVLPPDARVLDVGCAIGLYLAALDRRGRTVRGLDPSAKAAATAHALFGVGVDVGDAQTFDGYDAFDGIALLAVLEHLREPRRLLDTLARRMKPGATLIVEVPNADEFGRYPAIGRASEPLGEFSNEHINFFGEAALRRMAGEAGLSFVCSEPLRYTVGFDGLLAAFRKDGDADRSAPPTVSRASVTRYVAESRRALVDVEARIARATSGGPVVLYGAGSHSARLLAQGGLADADIEVVLDRNPHLTGRTIGGRRIALPETLRDFPDRPVIVSTFHALTSITDDLARRFTNVTVPLYASRD